MRALLVPIFGHDADERLLTAGAALAVRHRAVLVALFSHPDPTTWLAWARRGLTREGLRGAVEAGDPAIERHRDAARARFERIAGDAGLAPVAPPRPGAPAAVWREVATGRHPQTVPAAAVGADLVLLPQVAAGSAPDLAATLLATLVRSGRPILVLPEDAPPPAGGPVALAWNGTPAAVRALAGAMAFVDAATRLALLEVDAPFPADDGDPDAPLRDYIGWGGGEVTVRGLASGEDPVGAALLRGAREEGAELLVMGGYGHARLKEDVFGGVTRHVLAAATLPVLLAA